MHGDVGDTSGVYSDELALRRRITRMHREDACWDDGLQFEG